MGPLRLSLFELVSLKLRHQASVPHDHTRHDYLGRPAQQETQHPRYGVRAGYEGVGTRTDITAERIQGDVDHTRELNAQYHEIMDHNRPFLDWFERPSDVKGMLSNLAANARNQAGYWDGNGRVVQCQTREEQNQRLNGAGAVAEWDGTITLGVNGKNALNKALSGAQLDALDLDYLSMTWHENWHLTMETPRSKLFFQSNRYARNIEEGLTDAVARDTFAEWATKSKFNINPNVGMRNFKPYSTYDREATVMRVLANDVSNGHGGRLTQPQVLRHWKITRDTSRVGKIASDWAKSRYGPHDPRRIRAEALIRQALESLGTGPDGQGDFHTLHSTALNLQRRI